MSNVGQRALVLRNDGGNLPELARDPNGREGTRTATASAAASRWCPRPESTQYFTVTTAVGYLSASDKRLLVGLGAAATARLVEIRWPSGVVQTLHDVASGQTLEAVEPAP